MSSFFVFLRRVVSRDHSLIPSNVDALYFCRGFDSALPHHADFHWVFLFHGRTLSATEADYS